MGSSDFGKVAVLMGGTSNEREISLESGSAVLEALWRKNIIAEAIDPKVDDLFQLKSFRKYVMGRNKFHQLYYLKHN